MDLPPQPPPDVPAPPPGPEAIRSRKIMRWILLVGSLSILYLLAIRILPVAMARANAGHYKDQAVRNLRQIGLMIFLFDEEYGRFPDATTITTVQAATGTTLALGNSSSNDLFRQLLATVTANEMIFWADLSGNGRYPNGVRGPDALVPGECAFTYIAGLDSNDAGETPVVMAPVIRGTWKFDPKPFKGQAVVLFLDSSATALTIEENGDVILNGMNLFDPRQPFWRGKAPDIKYPE